MSKKQLLVLLFSWICLTAFSQSIDNRLSKWGIGFNAGANFSSNYQADTWANNFTGRNKTGFNVAFMTSYDLHDNVSLNIGIGTIYKGYRINCDTLNVHAKVARGFFALNVPLGLDFHQQINKTRFINERFGLVVNYSLRPNSDTVWNGIKHQYRITETNINKLYPMFYLGGGWGGVNSKGNRYHFGLTYQQPFGREMEMKIETGEFLSKSFLLNFRGGNLQATFTYYFNTGNFKKSEEYFY